MPADVILSRHPMHPSARSTRCRKILRLMGAALGLAVLLPKLAGAEPIRLGHEFVVNTYTTYIQRRTAVASAPDGRFVVAWRSTTWLPADYERAVLAQRYDSQGGKQAGEFLVNTETYNAQDEPAVAMAGDGSFVVVWESYPDYYHIAGQRFSSTGAPVGSEFRVNSSDGFTYYTSDVAMSPDGSFVVVWTHNSDTATGIADDEMAVLGRRFDSAGAPIGNDFLVNTYTTGYQVDPSVARMPDGSFIVVWSDNEQDAVVGMRYDSVGGSVGGAFTINQSSTSFGGPSVAGAPGHGFVVVWSTGFFSTADVLARRYDSSGVPQGGQFVVPATTLGYQGRSDVSMASDGSFVVAWINGINDGDVFARRFDSAGTPQGGEFQINEVRAAESAYRNSLAVSGPGDGSFVVTWVGDYSGYSDTDIMGARFGVGSVGCAPAPLTTCRETTVARRGIFRFRDSTNDARDALNWQWLKGEAVSSLERGDPFAGTAYALCVYDASVASQPIIHMESTAAGLCRAVPCWRPFNAGVIEYFDRDHLAGGLERLRLSPGAAGAARVLAKALGPNLDLPATPLTAPVTVQLQGSNGTCWSSTYSSSILQNSDGQFRARPDGATP